MKATKTRPRSGRKVTTDRVVLSRRRYERLLEDLHDLAVVAERRSEAVVSDDAMRKKLLKRGLL
ncbi:MAG: hypothetical protein EPO64_09070 [Nitrospirae bacterium]|nr:MAG: hypothetical protein EPO64_09070 [Nitrospirota bacterium]